MQSNQPDPTAVTDTNPQGRPQMTIDISAPAGDPNLIMVNGKPLPDYLRSVNQQLRLNSIAMQRSALASALGKQFNGDRDIYLAAGYYRDVTFSQMNGKYQRQDIARRLVDAPAVEAWRNPPEITDGNPNGPFMVAWRGLTDHEVVPNDLERLDNRAGVWESLKSADRLSGIGYYGGLLLGIADGKKLADPIEKLGNGKFPGIARLAYLTPLHEDQINVSRLVTDPQNPRYGRPEMYSLILGTGQPSVNVHWSRVIHIAENLTGDLVSGTPRMLPVFNLLEDLLKVTAGAGESAWKLMYKGMIITTKEGYTVDDGEPNETSATKAKAQDYADGLMRVLELDGFDVKIEGGEIVDPSPLIKIYISLISAATSIPQRILLGSERGELSSVQDDQNWQSFVQERQTNFISPVILRPFINRLIFLGILPNPVKNRFSIIWGDIKRRTLLDTVELNLKRAQIVKELTPPGAADQVISYEEIRELAILPPGNQTAVISDLLDAETVDQVAATAEAEAEAEAATATAGGQ